MNIPNRDFRWQQIKIGSPSQSRLDNRLGAQSNDVTLAIPKYNINRALVEFAEAAIDCSFLPIHEHEHET
jgi:hypothetical protein